VRKPLLSWKQHDARNWSAQVGRDQYHVAWNETRKNDWSALHAEAGRPFAQVEGEALARLVRDVTLWIRENGGEVPQAPEERVSA
jgi:hypothetical protein